MSNETQYIISVNAEGVYASLDKAGKSYDKFASIADLATKKTTASQQALAEALENATAAVARTGQAIAGTSTYIKENGDLSVQSANKVKRFMDALVQTSETTGLTAEQLLRFRAAQLGVSDSAEPMIQSIERTKQAQKDAADAAAALAAARREQEAADRAAQAAGDSFVSSLQNQVATFGLAGAALQTYKAAQLGVSAAAAPLIAQLEALEAAQTAANNATKAAAAAESARSAALKASVSEAQASSARVAAAWKKEADDRAAAERAAADAQIAADKAAEAETQKAIKTRQDFIDAVNSQAAAIGKSRAQLLAEQAAIHGATAETQDAIEKIGKAGDGAHGGMSGITREFIVIGHEAMTGNVSRIPGSMMVLAERLNLASIATTAVKTAMTALEAVAAAVSLPVLAVGAAITAVVIAAAAVGVAVHQGSAQFQEFSASIRTTNGYVGLTAQQMYDAADSMKTWNVTGGEARETLAAVASTGKFAGDQLILAGQAATAMTEATGEGADKAVASLSKMHDDILGFLKDYQNEHHAFTAAQVEEIENRKRNGDQIGAEQVALEALTKEGDYWSKQHYNQMGTVMRAWTSFKNLVTDTWNKIQGIGVPSSIDSQVETQKAIVAEAQKQADAINQSGGMAKIMAASAATRLANEKAVLATLEAQAATEHKATAQRAADAAGGDAQVALSSYVDDPAHAAPARKHDLQTKQADGEFNNLDQSLKNARDTAIKAAGDNAAAVKAAQEKYDTDYAAASSAHADRIAEIDREFQRKQGGGAKAAVRDDHSAQIKALQGEYKQVEDDLKTHLANIESQRKTGQISNVQAADQTYDTEKAAHAKMVTIRAQELSDVQSWGGNNKAITQQATNDLAAAHRQQEADEQKHANAVAAAQQKDLADAQKYGDRFKVLADKRAADANKAADELGMSSNQKQAYEQLLKTQQDFDNERAKLDAEYAGKTGAYDQAVLAQKKSSLDEAEAYAIAQDKAGNQRLVDGQASVTVGLSKAWADYQQNTADNIKGVGTLFGDVTNGLSDAFANFCSTGKLDFSSMTKSILADLAKIAAEKAIVGLATMAVSAFTGGGSDGTTTGVNSYGFSTGIDASANSYGVTGASLMHYATGGSINGPGTGTSDSIPAMLSNGEYVLTAETVKRIGVGTLDALNSGKHVHAAAHYATGGAVGNVAASTSGGNGSSTSVQVNLNGGNSGGLTKEDAPWLQDAITKLIDGRMAQKMTGQGGYLWRNKYGGV